MRSVQIVGSAQPHFRARASASCLALSDTLDAPLWLSLSSAFTLSTFLPPFPRDGFAFRPSRGSRRIGRMRALTAAAVSSVTALPAYLAIPSRLSASNHVMSPGIALHAISTQRAGRVSDFALNEQARRLIPPNRIRHPTDCRFASSCSPPRLAATQLLSASGSWLPPTRTPTALISRLHGRTHSRESGNPSFRATTDQPSDMRH